MNIFNINKFDSGNLCLQYKHKDALCNCFLFQSALCSPFQFIYWMTLIFWLFLANNYGRPGYNYFFIQQFVFHILQIHQLFLPGFPLCKRFRLNFFMQFMENNFENT